MLRLGVPKVLDINRYQRVFEAALGDLEPILSAATKKQSQFPEELKKTELGYRNYINLCNDIPSTSFGAGGTKSLVKLMARNLGYQLQFRPLGDNILIPIPGFVSWLMVNHATQVLTIIYNTKAIKARAGVDSTSNLKGIDMQRALAWADHLLAKIFLHEFAHASLHLEEFLARMRNGDMSPSLDPAHEQDAWVYACIIWGILLGDHSHTCRTISSSPDESWRFA